LQDEEDRVLVPLLSDVAVRARAAIERDLGVIMPRPLRIDLVRDLFSLSAVSGLPLKAAETTGTVAVARSAGFPGRTHSRTRSRTSRSPARHATPHRSGSRKESPSGRRPAGGRRAL